MTFDKFNRRTHLYAALFFLPWFFVYGLSSVVFSHPKWFNAGPAKFNVFFDREYRLDPIPPGADLRLIGEKIQKDNGLEDFHAVFLDAAGNLVLYKNTFWKATTVKYNTQTQRLTGQTDVFKWSSLLTRLHARGGFERPGFLENSWSVIVDIIQLSIIIWIASGIYMWWNLKHLRKWGALALGGGVAFFAIFLLRL